jgi:hypothetical protein
MSTRKHTPRARAFRPEAYGLESRQLLSGVVSGTDIDGDTWTLRLIGPGSLGVTKQNDSSGNPSPLSSATEINTITIGGTDWATSRLIGTVKKGPNGDGKVFFQNLIQLPGRSEEFPASGQAIKAIDMPNFWLGNTTPITSATTSPPPAPKLSLPDGAETLLFGGVDRTHDQAASPSTSNTANDVAEVTLGLPPYSGSRIVIDSSISSTQTIPGNPNASPPTSATVIQHGVTFSVGGRLQLFQANSIQGDAANPPGQFGNQNPNASGTGGTILDSSSTGPQPFFASDVIGIKGGVGGAIGFVKVGGNATNFTTVVTDPTGAGSDHISNYSVGGETNNIMIVAPTGVRDLFFGKGMDTAEIRTHVINRIKANRGAVNSNVSVDRQISLADFGGDVVNTRVISGVNQSYSNILDTISGFNPSFGQVTGSPAAPILLLNAQTSGGMTVHVAGDVVNSVFAASVQPVTSGTGTSQTFTFGGPNQVILPTGHISAKVEGTIDNSTATPGSPTTAFYAQHVQLGHSPVAPPHVPEPPYSHPTEPVILTGIPLPPKTATTKAATAGTTTAQAAHASTSSPAVASKATHPAVTVGTTTPQGPRTSLTTRG